MLAEITYEKTVDYICKEYYARWMQAEELHSIIATYDASNVAYWKNEFSNACTIADKLFECEIGETTCNVIVKYHTEKR